MRLNYFSGWQPDLSTWLRYHSASSDAENMEVLNSAEIGGNILVAGDALLVAARHVATTAISAYG
jgi:hypothetical protein